MIENEEVFDGDYPMLLKELFNYVESQTIDFSEKRRMLLAPQQQPLIIKVSKIKMWIQIMKRNLKKEKIGMM